jgi:mono/diheme cytochrome c family protein
MRAGNVQKPSFAKSFQHISRFAPALLLSLLAACAPEKRAVGPSVPLSAPVTADDPRAKLYETNAWQVSEGGRQFRWQGCDACHQEGSPGYARLTDHAWRYGGATTDLYNSIAEGRAGGMPAYQGKVTPEQIWQMAGYLHGLPDLPADKRARQTADQQGEPSGTRWSGPVS